MNRKNRPYTLKSYNPAWPAMFAKERDMLTSILGSVVLRMEHIGSTAVPGMLAKPQIDILVVVKNFADVDCARYKLEQVGYVFRGDYIRKREQYFTRDAKSGERLVSVHIFEDGNSHIDETLLFRDYLRAHPDERDLYAQAKRQAYHEGKNDRDEYAHNKKTVLEEIHARAIKSIL